MPAASARKRRKPLPGPRCKRPRAAAPLVGHAKAVVRVVALRGAAGGAGGGGGEEGHGEEGHGEGGGGGARGRAVLATASEDGAVRLWDAEGACLAELTGHTGQVMALTALAGGRSGRLVSGAGDGVRVWDVECACEVGFRAVDQLMQVSAVEGVGEDGGFVATVDDLEQEAGTMLVWYTVDEAPAAGLSPERRARGDGMLVREEHVVNAGHTNVVNDMAVWGEYIATASADATAGVWKARERVATLTGNVDSLYSVSMSDRYCVTGGWDSTIRVFAMDKWEYPMRIFEVCGSAVGKVVIVRHDYFLACDFEGAVVLASILENHEDAVVARVRVGPGKSASQRLLDVAHLEGMRVAVASGSGTGTMFTLPRDASAVLREKKGARGKDSESESDVEFVAVEQLEPVACAAPEVIDLLDSDVDGEDVGRAAAATLAGGEGGGAVFARQRCKEEAEVADTARSRQALLRAESIEQAVTSSPHKSGASPMRARARRPASRDREPIRAADEYETSSSGGSLGTTEHAARQRWPGSNGTFMRLMPPSVPFHLGGCERSALGKPGADAGCGSGSVEGQRCRVTIEALAGPPSGPRMILSSAPSPAADPAGRTSLPRPLAIAEVTSVGAPRSGFNFPAGGDAGVAGVDRGAGELERADGRVQSQPGVRIASMNGMPPALQNGMGPSSKQAPPKRIFGSPEDYIPDVRKPAPVPRQTQSKRKSGKVSGKRAKNSSPQATGSSKRARKTAAPCSTKRPLPDATAKKSAPSSLPDIAPEGPNTVGLPEEGRPASSACLERPADVAFTLYPGPTKRTQDARKPCEIVDLITPHGSECGSPSPSLIEGGAGTNADSVAGNLKPNDEGDSSKNKAIPLPVTVARAVGRRQSPVGSSVGKKDYPVPYCSRKKHGSRGHDREQPSPVAALGGLTTQCEGATLTSLVAEPKERALTEAAPCEQRQMEIEISTTGALPAALPADLQKWRGTSLDCVVSQSDLASFLAAYLVGYDPERAEEFSAVQRCLKLTLTNSGIDGRVLVGDDALPASDFMNLLVHDLKQDRVCGTRSVGYSYLLRKAVREFGPQ